MGRCFRTGPRMASDTSSGVRARLPVKVSAAFASPRCCSSISVFTAAGPTKVTAIPCGFKPPAAAIEKPRWRRTIESSAEIWIDVDWDVRGAGAVTRPDISRGALGRLGVSVTLSQHPRSKPPPFKILNSSFLIVPCALFFFNGSLVLTRRLFLRPIATNFTRALRSLRVGVGTYFAALIKRRVERGLA